MARHMKDEDFVRYSTKDMLHVAQSLIAVSSMVDAIVSEYANTGVVAVGALQHAGNVVDGVIEKLELAELDIQVASLPF